MSGLPKPPIALDPLLEDPDRVRRLVVANAPYAPVQRYFDNAAEYGALSGRKDAQRMFVAPVFRGDWATEGAPRIDGVAPLLHHPALIEAAGKLFDGSVVRPLAVYANLTWQLPFHQGQGHTDVPAFRGIDRSRHPVWLLSAMGHSGLFEEERIPIATAVCWFYEGSDGGLEYWPEGPDASSRVHEGRIHNTALLGDNDRMHHRVRPVGDPARGIVQGMTLESRLVHRGGEDWAIEDGGSELASFPWRELRISVSWKAYVLRDAEAARDVDTGRGALDLSTVVDRFLGDLAQRGLPCDAPADPLHDPDFVRLLGKTYFREPGPVAAEP